MVFYMDKIHDKNRIFTAEERKIILSKTAGKCAHCGCGLDVYSMTVDHIFPKSKGGLNDEYNLLPLCEDCNELKSDSVYHLKDFYKNIIKSEEERYYKYNNFATFDYTSKTIAGYDETLFYYVSPGNRQLLAQMKKRGVSDKKIKNLQKNMYTKINMRKAYPANADDIYKLIKNSSEKFKLDNPFYDSEYSVLEDIKNGCVYILENNNELLGVFLFKNAKQFKGSMNYPQLEHVIEYFNLKIKYIMSGVYIKRSAIGAFESIMRYLELNQIQNRTMPLFFNILSEHYSNSDKCISIPFNVNGVAAKLEFMPIAQLKELHKDHCEHIFEINNYTDYSEEELDIYAELSIRATHQKQFYNNDEALSFFKKYPLLLDYFKPDNYEFYNVGFVSSVLK